jgi:4-amino-4-deoxy-L-arabinose transferase-like glycosyltransferase
VSPSLSTRSLLAIVFALAILWFGTLDRSLTRPDEGRYAEIPREMVASGDWLTPRLNNLKYFEKPPLQYWATAVAYSLFGEHEWSARLWPALTGFLGILLIYVTGRRLYGPDAGAAAAILLAGMQGYLLSAHIDTLDSGLTFFMQATLCGLLLAQRAAATLAQERRWMLFAWAAMAGATLSKGLVGPVLPTMTVVLYALIERDRGLWARLHAAKGMALFLLLASPWFVWCTLTNPGFFHFFFIREHFERYLLHGHHREGDWWYYVPVLLVGLLPWLGHFLRLAPGMWARTAEQRSDGGKALQPHRLLVVWCVLVFLFFSASSSKLVSYILPVFPPLALLMGRRLTSLTPRTLIWLPAGAIVLALTGMALLPGMGGLASDYLPAEFLFAYRPWLVAAAAILAAGGMLSIAVRHAGALRASLVLAFASLIAGSCALHGLEVLAPATSVRALVRATVAREGPFRPDAPFYSVSMYEPTLAFYLKRTVIMVHYTDELAFGLGEEPDQGLPSVAAFSRAWRDLDQGYAIMEPAVYRACARRGVPMRVLGSGIRRVIVSRR